MDRRILICLIVVGLSLPLPVNAASPQPRELRPHASIDVWIPSGQYYTVTMTGLAEGDDISIDIQVTSGESINIYIFDYENYTGFIDGVFWRAAIRWQNEWFLTTTFSVPSSGTWYVVFYNYQSITKHIEGSVVSVSQQARGGLFIIIIIVLILVFICVCYVCLKKQSDKDKKKQPQPHPDPQQPAQPPQYRPTPQQDESVRFCPYCGTPKQIFDAKFCSKCGRAFSGPNLG